MRLIRWSITFTYAAFIFYLSSRTWTGAPLFPGADKIIHLAIYAVLGALCVWSLTGTAFMKRPVIVPLAVAMTALYGISDEVHQMYVAGRTAEVYDFISDAIGGTIGSIVVYFILKQKSGERTNVLKVVNAD